MSKSKVITLRVQSPDGTKRIDIEQNDSTFQLFEKVHETFGLRGYNFALYRQRGNKDEVLSSRSKTVRSAGVCHGDMIYLAPLNGMLLNHDADSRPSSSYSHCNEPMEEGSPQSSPQGPLPVVEDDVDLQLQKLDGKIQRKKDDKLCRHGANACCVHCSPLEPFDEAYLKEQSIKHLSFHAYLRKLTAGVDRGKFVSLEDISCRIKLGCKDHPPWPKGICSKCQPNAITLNRQVYRHVDNVVFENPHLVERFLNYWRTTGHQRIGFLYGKYEIHSDVPLGIRATVAAIYEPPQESSPDEIILLEDHKEAAVEGIAQQLGLQKVGWIFTDLIADDIKKGTVKHVRNIQTHFLTAEECIMAGYYQNQHPNSCRFSPVGQFGSKFVTVCVTGDASNQVHMEGYQVSNQCMALVRDDCLVPTNIAELGYVREASDKQYVPDVYYKEKDNYGNEVSRLARPLPVEYLLLDVPASTPLNPLYTFYASPHIQPFPVENRMLDGQIQDFQNLNRYLRQFQPDEFLKAASDFHFLLYIATMDMLDMKEYMNPILEAVKTKNSNMASSWSHSEQWMTIEQLMDASLASGGHGNDEPNAMGGAAPPASTWTCSHCTYRNSSGLVNCEMCSLPKS